MTKIVIDLKLVESGKNDYELQWSQEGSAWAKVTPDSPTTEVADGDTLEWNADSSSIRKTQIKFKKGNIIPNDSIKGNDTDCVSATVSNVKKDESDSYTIKVQPVGGGGLKEYDPNVKTPPHGPGGD
ncbi:MAG: hypothetical protein JXR03_08325 [Cyclobacteriaceae bacterium]